MIELKAFMLAEYANANKGSLTIAGTLDSVEVRRAPGVPESEVRDIRMPRLYVVIVTEASLADGLEHQTVLRILDGGGNPILSEMELALTFVLNDLGRRMRSNVVVAINDVVFPTTDDYEFELSIKGDPPVRLGVTTLTVVDRTAADG